MRGWTARLRGRLAAVDWRSQSRRTALAGFWVLRWCLGIVLVVYALSFVGPPPVSDVAVSDSAPDEAPTAAVATLHASTYRVTIEGERTDESGVTTPFVRETRTVDNRGHRYATRRKTGPAAGNESRAPQRTYGTYTTGYRHGGGGTADGTASNDGTGAWARADRLRYHPSRNAFESPAALNETDATVLADTGERYVLRVEGRDAVARAVTLPGHSQRREESWNATLTLTVSRDKDRLTRAEYQYHVPATGERVRATYRFTYGPGVDVDRPLATYPPGAEVGARLDLGLRSIERLAGGYRP